MVALSWLNGPSRAAAIRVIDGDRVEWHGQSPGDRAELLPDGAFRWAGPDGSMVGCGPAAARAKTPQHCVGVDAQGDVALTDGSSGLRSVYGPDGKWLGAFRANGTPASGRAPARSRAEALAASGVDLPALVDFATGAQPFAGGITGDPHLITIGGARVSTQRSGDFEARTGDPTHHLQVRIEPMPYRADVGYVTAIGIGTGNHRIEFDRNGRLRVDGVAQSGGAKFRQVEVPGGPAVGWWPPNADGIVDAVVLWPDGSTVTLAADAALGLTIGANLPSAAVAGLFGTQQLVARTPAAGSVPTTPANGNEPSSPRLDFAARAPAAGTLSDEQVVDTWRVPAGESLIGGPAPVAGATPTSPAVDAVATAAAESACAAGRFNRSEDLAACVFDVTRTGDTGYVAHHAELAAASTGPVVPAWLSASYPGLVLGSVSSATPLALGTPAVTDVGPAARRVFVMQLSGAARISVRSPDCRNAGTAEHPAAGAAAVRMFDAWGAPVSDRLATCGAGVTPLLAAGTYYLLLAGPRSTPAASFAVHLTAF